MSCKLHGKAKLHALKATGHQIPLKLLGLTFLDSAFIFKI